MLTKRIFAVILLTILLCSLLSISVHASRNVGGGSFDVSTNTVARSTGGGSFEDTKDSIPRSVGGGSFGETANHTNYTTMAICVGGVLIALIGAILFFRNFKLRRDSIC